MKLEPDVRKQLLQVILGTLILSLVMELVFVVIGKWSPMVLFGNLCGAGAAILDFWLLCLTCQRAVMMKKEDAMKSVRSSKSLRMLLMLAVCILPIALFHVNVYATVIPLLFPQLILKAMNIRAKNEKK